MTIAQIVEMSVTSPIDQQTCQTCQTCQCSPSIGKKDWQYGAINTPLTLFKEAYWILTLWHGKCYKKQLLSPGLQVLGNKLLKKSLKSYWNQLS